MQASVAAAEASLHAAQGALYQDSDTDGGWGPPRARAPNASAAFRLHSTGAPGGSGGRWVLQSIVGLQGTVQQVSRLTAFQWGAF